MVEQKFCILAMLVGLPNSVRNTFWYFRLLASIPTGAFVLRSLGFHMTSLNFVYWLQGFLEIEQPKMLKSEQIQIIEDHIKLVLSKETPPRILNDIWNLDGPICVVEYEGSC